MNHINPLSREKVALSQEDGAIGDFFLDLLDLFDPVSYLTFLAAVLTAVNNFIVRKVGSD